MAGKEGDGLLKNKHYTRLAAVISLASMEAIAQGYLDIDADVIMSVKQEKMMVVTSINAALLQRWAHRNENSGADQIKRLAKLLYEAADDASYVNPNRVYDILGVTQDEANSDDTTEAPSVPPPVQQAPSVPPPEEEQGPKFNMAMLVKLSKRINSEEDLLTLALIGLGMEENSVLGHLRNSAMDIHAAARNVLSDWRKSRPNDRIAYDEMCAALQHEDVQLANHIVTALQ